MPIPLNEPGGSAGYPVLKRQAIGESFIGALVHLDQRQTQRDGQPQFKPDGKPRYELVVTLMTLQSNMVAGSGDAQSVPQPGDLVRMIMKGGGYGDWIEAKNDFVGKHRPIEVGDFVQVTTTHAIRYESMGQHRALGEIHSQDELNAYYQAMVGPQARQESLGFRGGLSITVPPPEHAQTVAQCEEHYTRITTKGIQAEAPAPATGALVQRYQATRMADVQPERVAPQAPPTAPPAPTPPPVHQAPAPAPQAAPPAAPAPAPAESGFGDLFGN